MDKSDADPLQRQATSCCSYDVVPEEFGGDDAVRRGVRQDRRRASTTLLDAIPLQAEVLELRAVLDGRATGVVIESALDKGRGPVATVLVQQGTLKKGDYLVLRRAVRPRARAVRRDRRQAGRIGRPVDPGAGARPVRRA